MRGKDLIKILEKQGFVQIRQRGSHARLVHSDGRKTSVPIHSGEKVHLGLLRKILRDAGFSPEEFNRLQ
ncbi:type II toxin-antitoxin system HicA family toxin [Candidatus Collierbacteria bacterium]|nr:type II toxin-antitoxin system HicA family toxin [Candidatus Collierbacteria bacterium]